MNTFLKKNNIFKVPEVPKKVLPEEKKPTPIPKKVEAPPPKGTLISNKPKTKRLTNCHSTALLIIMTYVGNS